MARRWIPSPTMMSDLTKARDISAAAFEATGPDAAKGSAVASDKHKFAELISTATCALDSALAIAERNKPKPKKVLEDLPNGF